MNEGRAYPARPIVGVGAVIVDDDRVLLVKRAHEPLKGEWTLPGGGVELGETLEAALIREVFEETALTIEVGPVVDVVDRIHGSSDGRIEFHFVIVDYLCHPSGAAQPAHGSDADDARWVRSIDLPSYHIGDTAMAVVRKAQQLAAARR